MVFPLILQPEAAQLLNLNQQLESFEVLPVKKQEEIQDQSLHALFAWAHAHSPFWRERLDAANWTPASDARQILKCLPVLGRSDVQTHYEALVCAAAFPPNTCFLSHTTGSTGQPVCTVKHHPTYNALYQAFSLRSTLWHRLDVSKPLLHLGVRVEDKVLLSWGAPEARLFKTGPQIMVSSRGRDFADVYALLKHHQPTYLVANAGVAQGLARYALDQDLQDRPELYAILTTGQASDETVRLDCQRAFGAKVIDRYSSEEVGWIAVQCQKHDHLHVQSANVIVEIVDDNDEPCKPGQPGRVLVTALRSEAMPLIRYDLGDIAEWGNACDCGMHLPVIRRVWGRQREFVRGPNGELRHVALLAEDLVKIAPIRDMRLRLYTNPLARYELVCKPELTTTQRVELVATIQRLLGFQYPVEIIEVEAINWDRLDKRMGFAVLNEAWIDE